ncbi:MAG TPA: c-type cytochrome biogenesis protein CcmI [Caulobacteraceae bacterium]
MMSLFWIVAALIAAAAAALVMARAARGASAGMPADPSVGVYRRALREIDELADRELIAADERLTARAEAGRRLLTAAARVEPAPARSSPRAVLIALASVGPLAALGLYLAIGSPGAADQPFAARLAQWRAKPQDFQAPQLAAALRSVAAQRPYDPEPQRRLAELDMVLGDADGAVHALRKAIAIAPGRADLLAPLGEILVLKGQGVVSPEAQAIFRRVLAVDPASPTARYYLGRGAIEGGDATGGLALWRSLLADLPQNDPRRSGLAGDIAAVETTGRLPVAGGLAPSQQAAMSGAIRGMVDGLAARLKAHPDDPDGWVRLVRAYAVLGETAERDAALAQARRLYVGRPEIAAQLAAAVRAPGPAE